LRSEGRYSFQENFKDNQVIVLAGEDNSADAAAIETDAV
jgi:hypothetical protein